MGPHVLEALPAFQLGQVKGQDFGDGHAQGVGVLMLTAAHLCLLLDFVFLGLFLGALALERLGTLGPVGKLPAGHVDRAPSLQSLDSGLAVLGGYLAQFHRATDRGDFLGGAVGWAHAFPFRMRSTSIST